MHRFWPVVEPILSGLRSRSIVQIGGDDRATAELRRLAREHGAAVYVAAAGPRTERTDELLPRVGGEADLVLVDAAEDGLEVSPVLALLDALTPGVAGGFPVCLLRGAAGAEVERFLGVTSRDLAFAPVPGHEELGILCERGLLEPLLASAADGDRGPHEPEAGIAEGRLALAEAQLKADEDRLEDLEAALVEQSELLHATWSSRYWRLTAPLRRAVEAARSLRARLSRRGSGHAVEIPLASLDWAEAEAPGERRPRWRRAPEIGIRTTPHLDQPVRSRVVYRLSAPAGTTFQSQVGLRTRLWAPTQAGATARVRARGADGALLGEASAQLKPRMVDRRPTRAHLVVGFGPGGEECRLELEVEAAKGATPRAAAGWEGASLLVPASPREPAAPPATRTRHRRGGEPVISILMPVHDPPPDVLERAIESVVAQRYPHWQLCIADDGSRDPSVVELLRSLASRDPRIVLVRREQAGGISAGSNAALEAASGEFVALLDHDDELEPDALEEVAAVLRQRPETDVVYTDEDRILADGSRFAPVLKPDWSPDFLRAGMYTCHLGVYRRALVQEVGGFRSEYDGSQDFDLMLRLVERTDRVEHVPRVLYHWRAGDASVAVNPMAKPWAYDAGRRALQDHLDRTGVAGTASRTDLPGLYRITHRVDPQLRVSILVVLDGDPGQSLRECARGIAQRTAHRNWELVCACPDPLADAAAGALDELGPARGRVVTAPPGEPTGARLERAAREATGEQVVLLAAPCIPLDEGWIDVLAGFSVQQRIAAAGARVERADGMIEHAGILIGSGLPLPAYRGVRGDYVGYLGTLVVATNYAAVASAVMTRRELLLDLGLTPWPSPLAEADYCLRAGRRGLRSVLAPDARLRLVDAPAADAVPLTALADFKQAWHPVLPRDPHYHGAFWQVRSALPSPRAAA